SKLRYNLFVITIFTFLFSFILNIWQVHQDPVRTFYSPQTRFWELQIGSILFFLHRYLFIGYEKISTKYSIQFKNILSILGILSLVLSFLLVSNNHSFSFPGWWALLPTL